MAKIRVEWKDILFILKNVPLLVLNWPTVKSALKNLYKTDPDVRSFVDTLDAIRDRLTD